MKSAPITLPLSTSRTVTGPKFHGDIEHLIIDYDYEHDDGSIEWTRILFPEPLTFEYRRDSLCNEHDIVEPDEVRWLSSSEWLKEIVGRLSQSSMWREWQEKKGGIGRFKHFTMYFDDIGCIDVIGSSCSIAADVKQISDTTPQ